MSPLPACGRSVIRQTDTNSLLRMYDQVKGMANTASSQQQKERVANAIQSFTAELEKRKVSE